MRTALRLQAGAPLAAEKLLQAERWQQRTALCQAFSAVLSSHDLLSLTPQLNHDDAAERIHWLASLLLDAVKWQQGAGDHLVNLDQPALIERLANESANPQLQYELHQWLACRQKLLTIAAVNRELLLTERLLDGEQSLSTAVQRRFHPFPHNRFRVNSIMLLVDSHCHLDGLDYQSLHKDVADVLDKAKRRDVGFILAVATTLPGFRAMTQLIGERDNVAFSCGVHPLNQDAPYDYAELRRLAASDSVVALGRRGWITTIRKRRKRSSRHRFASTFVSATSLTSRLSSTPVRRGKIRWRFCKKNRRRSAAACCTVLPKI